MRKTVPVPPQLCPQFHRTSELVGRRWTGAVIFLLLRSRCRFAVLRHAIPDITDRMLSERLQELEAEGVVVRTVIPEAPVRVEYALTKKGRALAPAIRAMTAWAHKYAGAPDGGAGIRRSAARPAPTSSAAARSAVSRRRRAASRPARTPRSSRPGTSQRTGSPRPR